MPPASIAIAEQIDIAAPVDVVWSKITDPHFIVTCVPGATVIDERPDGTIEGALQVKLGPTVVDFHGTATPEFEQAQKRGRLLAQGADKGGRSRAQARMVFDVVAVADTKSQVTFEGSIELAGGLASFLQTGGVHLTRRMMKDFGEQLSNRIEVSLVAMTESPGDADSPPLLEPRPAPVNGLRLILLTIWDLIRSLFRRRGASRKRQT